MNILKPIWRHLKRTVRQWKGQDPKIKRKIKLKTQRFGSDYGGWWICPEKLPKIPIVYSIGVGLDISFDLALIATLNAQIFAYDPTPKTCDWIQTQSLPNNFVFNPVALAQKKRHNLLSLTRSTRSYIPHGSPRHLSQHKKN